MKKAIIETNRRIMCPYCKENRGLMLLVTAPLMYFGYSPDSCKGHIKIQCVSCKKRFEAVV